MHTTLEDPSQPSLKGREFSTFEGNCNFIGSGLFHWLAPPRAMPLKDFEPPHIQRVALYLYYIYARGLPWDAGRVAPLLHIEHGTLHEHTVGAVDAHADRSFLLGVEDECAVAHCRIGREDGLNDANALGNALHGSDGLSIGKAQDVGAAERDGRNVGAREVRHRHAFHRCGLATTGKREVDVGQFFLRHDREAQQGEQHGCLPAQVGKRKVLHTFYRIRDYRLLTTLHVAKVIRMSQTKKENLPGPVTKRAKCNRFDQKSR